MLYRYFIPSFLNTVLYGQAHPKPSQNHHLDPIRLIMDGSESGLLKTRIRICEKTRIHPDPKHWLFLSSSSIWVLFNLLVLFLFCESDTFNFYIFCILEPAHTPTCSCWGLVQSSSILFILSTECLHKDWNGIQSSKLVPFDNGP